MDNTNAAALAAAIAIAEAAPLDRDLENSWNAWELVHTLANEADGDGHPTAGEDACDAWAYMRDIEPRL